MLARSTACRRRGPDLGERRVDEQQPAVADEQVRRLDVAMCESGLPEPAHQVESLVDDAVVDVGVPDFAGSIEEFHDHEVFTFRGDLHDADGFGDRQPGSVEEAQRVVLVLNEAADAVERLLVLQAAIQQCPSELVPAVGAQMSCCVELAEEVRVGVALHLDAQGRRAARPFEAEGLHLDQDDAELVLERVPDRDRAAAGSCRGAPSGRAGT